MQFIFPYFLDSFGLELETLFPALFSLLDNSPERQGQIRGHKQGNAELFDSCMVKTGFARKPFSKDVWFSPYN